MNQPSIFQPCTSSWLVWSNEEFGVVPSPWSLDILMACLKVIQVVEKKPLRNDMKWRSRLWHFTYFLYFYPETWGKDPIWRAYFSDGLVQPPTSIRWPNCVELELWIFFGWFYTNWTCETLGATVTIEFKGSREPGWTRGVWDQKCQKEDDRLGMVIPFTWPYLESFNSSIVWCFCRFSIPVLLIFGSWCRFPKILRWVN